MRSPRRRTARQHRDATLCVHTRAVPSGGLRGHCPERSRSPTASAYRRGPRSRVRRTGERDRARPWPCISSAVTIRRVPSATCARRRARARALRQSRSDRVPRARARARRAVARRTRANDQREIEVRVALAQPLHELHGFASERVRQTRSARTRSPRSSEASSSSFRSPIPYGSCTSCAPTRWRRSLATSSMIWRGGLATMESRLEVDSVLVRTAVYEGRFSDACRVAERRPHTARPRHRIGAAYGADPCDRGAMPLRLRAVVPRPTRSGPGDDARRPGARQGARIPVHPGGGIVSQQPPRGLSSRSRRPSAVSSKSPTCSPPRTASRSGKPWP